MPAPAQDKTETLLSKILESVRGTQERLRQIERDDRLRALRLGQGALPEPDRSSATALAFCNAAAIVAAVSAAHCASLVRNQRLAEIFRCGSIAAIAAEPELTGTAEVLDLGQEYFATVTTGHSTQAAGAISALRDLLADRIAKGVRLELKPAFKEEYDAFRRDYLERSRAIAQREK